MSKKPEHASLPPSGTNRWFNCPGSIRLGRGKKSKETAAGIEGTLAHKYASDILLEEDKLSSIPTKNMREAVERYVEFVWNLEDSYGDEFGYIVEKKIDLTHLGGDVWGTADYASWEVGKDLYVIDYKNGLVTVEAKDNTQLLTYALGVLEKIGYNFRHVYIVIAQPRAAHVLGPIRSCRYTMDAMKKFKDILIEKIKATQKKNAPLKSGTWCQYCPAVGSCPEIVGVAQDIARSEFSDVVVHEEDVLPAIDAITDDQIARILTHKKALLAWLDAITVEAAERLETGSIIPGLKLVRSVPRARWIDPDNLPTELTIVKPMTITQARDEFDDIEDLIERPDGILIAAPDVDGRPPYVSAQVEFK
jgi:CRISPR/Cas system-associated exonuclease Cas4 (RecB family)